MKCATALLATVVSVSVLHAGAHRPLVRSPSATSQQSSGADAWPPVPQAWRANLTEILTLDGPFRTFLTYLQQTSLVEVFQNHAYLTGHGITIFVPVDRAFAAVQPSVSGLSRHELKSLMMYHSLARHYELAEFEALSRANPVATLAGGAYTVNVAYDAGVIRVRSRWADAKVVGSVSVAAPVAVYELDRVLLPDALFRAQPPVAATPVDAPAPAPSGEDAAVAPRQYGSAGVKDAASSARAAGDRFASCAAAAAFSAAALMVALCEGVTLLGV
ncbi:hypothetical protein ACP70R_011484 [Stipagrostis hirtigluma subsp. patula]